MDGDSESGGPAYFMRHGTRVQFGAPALELARAQAAATVMPSNESVFARFKSPMDTTPVTEVGAVLSRSESFGNSKLAPHRKPGRGYRLRSRRTICGRAPTIWR